MVSSTPLPLPVALWSHLPGLDSQVVTDKTVTTTFQGMALDGMRHPLSWSEGTQVSNRVD